MNRAAVQKIYAGISECCVLTNQMYTAIYDRLDNWDDTFLLCCATFNCKAKDIIDLLEDWAAEYSATFTDFICQIEVTTTTTTAEPTTTTTQAPTTTTTLTTIDPDLEQWTIEFEDYLCQQEDDPDYTTTIPLKSEEIEFVAIYTDFLCQQEDNPAISTTTTTGVSTTTTSQIDPEDVEFSGTYTDFLCQQTDNPLISTTTSTTTIDEDAVTWKIEFEDYLCQQTDVTTTTTTQGPTTTAEVSTTTSTVSSNCGTLISGEMATPEIHHINLGADTGLITLTIDSVEVPDKFVVVWNGMVVINTGYRGDTAYQSALYAAQLANGLPYESIAGSAGGTFTFNKTTADPIATVYVYAPMTETQWSFRLSCVGATSTTTTEVYDYDAEYTDFVCVEVSDGLTTTTTTAQPTTTLISTTTTTAEETPTYAISCGPTEVEGTYAPMTVYIVSLGATTGLVQFNYESIDIADRYVVEFDGVDVIDTGIVSGSGSLSFNKNSATELAIVRVYNYNVETKWSFSILCPSGSTTTSTTSTTLATTTTTTTLLPLTVDDSFGASFNPGTCGEKTYPYTVNVLITPFNVSKGLFQPDMDYTILEYIEVTEVSISAGLDITYDGSTLYVGQIINSISNFFEWELGRILVTRAAEGTNSLAATIKIKLKYQGYSLSDEGSIFVTFLGCTV